MPSKVLHKKLSYKKRPPLLFSIFGLKNKTTDLNKINNSIKKKRSSSKNKNKKQKKLIPAPISNCAPPPPPLPPPNLNKLNQPSLNNTTTTNKENKELMYPKIVDQITGGIAKVVQKATDSYVFQDLPECGVLLHTERLSMKLIDPQVHRCLTQLPSWRPEQERLDSINFAIRDESNKKRQLMSAQLKRGGLILKNVIGKTIMIINLPIHSADSLGKIMHPSQATLYKLMHYPSGPDLKLVKASSDEAIVLRVEKVHISLQSFGKAIGIMGSDCVYWLKSSDGQTVYGHVRPKFTIKRNTLIVKFMSKQKDIQLRAAMLGTALLLLINEVYPQLRIILSEHHNQQNID